MIKMVTLWLISFEELWFSINALFHISIISTQDLFRSPNIKYLYQRAGVNEGKYSSFFFLEYPFFRLATSILNFNPNNLNTFLIPFFKKFSLYNNQWTIAFKLLWNFIFKLEKRNVVLNKAVLHISLNDNLTFKFLHDRSENAMIQSFYLYF